MVIYKATNILTGLIYIGQTSRPLKARQAEHRRAGGNISDTKNPTLFHRAIREHGYHNFVWEIIKECKDQDDLNIQEIFFIKELNTMDPHGYNETRGGSMDGSMSQKIRDKISDAVVKLHKDPEYAANLYPQLKGRIPPNKGVAMSEEQKSKVSASKKAVYANPEYVNPNTGSKRTPQQIKNIKDGIKNPVKGDKWYDYHEDQYTLEVRAKMSAAKKGKKPANTQVVICIETEQEFKGLTEASQVLKVNRQSIWMQIKGKCKTAGGLHFKYKE